MSLGLSMFYFLSLECFFPLPLLVKSYSSSQKRLTYFSLLEAFLDSIINLFFKNVFNIYHIPDAIVNTELIPLSSFSSTEEGGVLQGLIHSLQSKCILRSCGEQGTILDTRHRAMRERDKIFYSINVTFYQCYRLAVTGIEILFKSNKLKISFYLVMDVHIRV